MIVLDLGSAPKPFVYEGEEVKASVPELPAADPGRGVLRREGRGDGRGVLPRPVPVRPSRPARDQTGRMTEPR